MKIQHGLVHTIPILFYIEFLRVLKQNALLIGPESIPDIHRQFIDLALNLSQLCGDEILPLSCQIFRPRFDCGWIIAAAMLAAKLMTTNALIITGVFLALLGVFALRRAKYILGNR